MLHDSTPAAPDPISTKELRRQISRTVLVLNTLIPAVLLFGVLAADNLLSATQLLDALAATAVGVPIVMLGIVFPILSRLTRPLFEALETGARGEEIPEALLEKARRIAFAQPWRSGATVLVLWGLVLPLVYAAFIPHLTASARQQVAIAGALLGPLMAFIVVSAAELLLRPIVARLFPAGGIAAYRGPLTLTTRRRLITSFFLLGPYLLLILALLAYQRVATSTSIAEALGRLPWVEAYFVLAATVLCWGMGQVVRLTLGEPLWELTTAMSQVQSGNLDVKVTVDNADMPGLMADSFNRMVEGLRERIHLKDAFGRYVSPELASQVSAGPVQLGGQSRVVTVLFSDIRNFTALSERMAAQDLVAMLNRYFEAMVECIRSEGGSVNKFLGDGIMALFGAPSELPDAALAAVRSALKMGPALQAFNVAQEALGLPALAIGVGIATGSLVVGNVGSADRLEYTAIGDVVNTASRIEGLTKEFGAPVLLDETTFLAVDGRIPVGMKGRVPVKGKTEAVTIYAPAVGTADLAAWPALHGMAHTGV